uniref:MORF/ORRM1/DAG-like MORF domain-containing protein n=1 Tax=Kalanchoe fedtschenkoi TaxID=63787 RepID=A0A7N0VC49_KALFE
CFKLDEVRAAKFMELLLSSSSLVTTSVGAATTARTRGPNTSRRPFSSALPVTFPNSFKRKALSSLHLSTSSCNASIRATTSPTPAPSVLNSESAVSNGQRHLMVLVEAPPGGGGSKAEIVDYYVEILGNVMRSEADAQMCIYDVSCGPQYGFCCDVDEETARRLSGLPEVLSVRLDYDSGSIETRYGISDAIVHSHSNAVDESIKL